MTRCAISALSEPLLGTATQARYWIFVEHPGPWPRDALDSAGLDPRLHEWNALPGARVQLVRHPQRKGARERVWLFDAQSHHFQAGSHELFDRIPRWLTGEFVEAESSNEMLFVCAHAKRDQCCAIDGRACVAVADSEHVWETSHLGGHRFAPTALLAPLGIMLGRLESAPLPFPPGDIHSHLRGDVRFSAPEQVAAGIAMREWNVSPTEISSVELVARSPHSASNNAVMDFRVSGHTQQIVIAVTESVLPERLESCGGEAKSGTVFTGRIASACG